MVDRISPMTIGSRRVTLAVLGRLTALPAAPDEHRRECRALLRDATATVLSTRRRSESGTPTSMS